MICGKHSTRFIWYPSLTLIYSVGAAGNFLAPISGLSENAFKTVIEIDTVKVS